MTFEEKMTRSEPECPTCRGELCAYVIMTVGEDRYRRWLRRFFGWCMKCDAGFEVYEFVAAGAAWRVHKYRPYKQVDKNCEPVATGDWVIVNEMPEPAPVIIGPGGDFDQAFSLGRAGK